jgi:hypothetical protein
MRRQQIIHTAVLIPFLAGPAFAQSTFSYQGRLDANGTPVS